MGDSLVQRQNRRRDETARSHVDQLAESLNEMRKAGLNCDCCIEVTGWGIKVSSQVHYAVVSAASEYCRSNSGCKYGKWTVKVNMKSPLIMHGTIEVLGRESLTMVFWLHKTKLVKTALEQCIEFMYIGKADIRDDTVECITVISHKLQLKPLEDMGLETMHDNLTTCDSCSWLLQVARDCERREYEEEVITKWISIHLQQILGLNECSSENLWRSAALLFHNSPDFSSLCEMLDVLKVIEIEKADCKFLLDVVMTNNEVTEDSEAARYVFKTICQKITREPSNLNCGNYYKVKNLLARYGSNETSGMKTGLEKIMINNFDVLAQQDEFLETNQDEVTSIFSSPQLTCTEKIKFDSMMKWVKHKPDERGAIFPGLFNLIKLQNFSEEELIDVKKNPLVESNALLLSSVFDALANQRKTSAVIQPQQLSVHPDTARWVIAQRPEVDNSSDASVRSRRSTCDGNTISNFSTASLRESLLSMPTTTDSGADVDGYRADCSLDDEN